MRLRRHAREMVDCGKLGAGVTAANRRRGCCKPAMPELRAGDNVAASTTILTSSRHRGAANTGRRSCKGGAEMLLGVKAGDREATEGVAGAASKWRPMLLRGNIGASTFVGAQCYHSGTGLLPAAATLATIGNRRCYHRQPDLLQGEAGVAAWSWRRCYNGTAVLPTKAHRGCYQLLQRRHRFLHRWPWPTEERRRRERATPSTTPFRSSPATPSLGSPATPSRGSPAMAPRVLWRCHERINHRAVVLPAWESWDKGDVRSRRALLFPFFLGGSG